MKIINTLRTVIGEGPVWNEKEQKLYYVNPRNEEYRILDVYTGTCKYMPTSPKVSAIAFTDKWELIASQPDGVHILNPDGTRTPLYDKEKYDIRYCNDMKVGPDGRLYVGTLSQKMLKISEETDGKFYSIDNEGNVKVLLENIHTSNGLDWSLDEKYLYYTDSHTKIIKEYAFDKENGTIEFTGREVNVPGVDGFTVDMDGNIIAACWGRSHIAIVDTKLFEVKDHIPVPAKIPASCAFAGKNMEKLIVVTANYEDIKKEDENAGFTFLYNHYSKGRKPYLFKTKD